MKKMICVLLAMILCFALAGSVLADFTPSVTYKGVPDFADGAAADDGCRIVGYVTRNGEEIGEIHYNPNGHIYATIEAVHENGCGVGHRCLILTPLSIAETDKEIPEASKERLLWVYEQIKTQGIGFIRNEELDAYIKEQLGPRWSIEDLIVRDLFDVSVLCDELEEYLEPEGSVVCLDFELGLEPDSFVAVLVYKNDRWQMIENAEVLEDGTVTCTTFEHFCPVAILVANADGPAASDDVQSTEPGEDAAASNDAPVAEDDADVASAPGTGTEENNLVWYIVGGVALVALIAVFAAQNKGKKKQ